MIPQFQKYVCLGDSVTFEHAGFEFTARLHEDLDTNPADFDMTDVQIAGWRAGRWMYVGVVLSAAFNGVQVEENAASLWGVGANYGPDNAYLSEVVGELLPKALEVAKGARVSMLAKLSEVH